MGLIVLVNGENEKFLLWVLFIEFYEFLKSPVNLFVWNHQFSEKIA